MNARKSRLYCLGGCLIVAMCCTVCLVIGFGIGLMAGEEQSYQKEYDRERELIEPILQEPQYSQIELHRRSNGGVYLVGEVPSRAVRDHLYEAVVRAVGESRAQEILLAVSPNR